MRTCMHKVEDTTKHSLHTPENAITHRFTVTHTYKSETQTLTHTGHTDEIV